MTWSHAFRLPPLRQGELDHLCGLYAIANGVRLLLGMLPTRIGTTLLFQELVRLADNAVVLQAALTHGIEAPDLWRIVKATARNVARAGCSLRDVRMLGGHRSIETTQRYVDGDSDAQRRLVALI